MATEAEKLKKAVYEAAEMVKAKFPQYGFVVFGTFEDDDALQIAMTTNLEYESVDEVVNFWMDGKRMVEKKPKLES